MRDYIAKVHLDEPTFFALSLANAELWRAGRHRNAVFIGRTFKLRYLCAYYGHYRLYEWIATKIHGITWIRNLAPSNLHSLEFQYDVEAAALNFHPGVLNMLLPILNLTASRFFLFQWYTNDRGEGPACNSPDRREERETSVKFNNAFGRHLGWALGRDFGSLGYPHLGNLSQLESNFKTLPLATKHRVLSLWIRQNNCNHFVKVFMPWYLVMPGLLDSKLIELFGQVVRYGRLELMSLIIEKSKTVFLKDEYVDLIAGVVEDASSYHGDGSALNIIVSAGLVTEKVKSRLLESYLRRRTKPLPSDGRVVAIASVEALRFFLHVVRAPIDAQLVEDVLSFCVKDARFDHYSPSLLEERIQVEVFKSLVQESHTDLGMSASVADIAIQHHNPAALTFILDHFLSLDFDVIAMYRRAIRHFRGSFEILDILIAKTPSLATYPLHGQFQGYIPSECIVFAVETEGKHRRTLLEFLLGSDRCVIPDGVLDGYVMANDLDVDLLDYLLGKGCCINPGNSALLLTPNLPSKVIRMLLDNDAVANLAVFRHAVTRYSLADLKYMLSRRPLGSDGTHLLLFDDIVAHFSGDEASIMQRARLLLELGYLPDPALIQEVSEFGYASLLDFMVKECHCPVDSPVVIRNILRRNTGMAGAYTDDRTKADFNWAVENGFPLGWSALVDAAACPAPKNYYIMNYVVAELKRRGIPYDFAFHAAIADLEVRESTLAYFKEIPWSPNIVAELVRKFADDEELVASFVLPRIVWLRDRCASPCASSGDIEYLMFMEVLRLGHLPTIKYFASENIPPMIIKDSWIGSQYGDKKHVIELLESYGYEIVAAKGKRLADDGEPDFPFDDELSDPEESSSERETREYQEKLGSKMMERRARKVNSRLRKFQEEREKNMDWSNLDGDDIPDPPSLNLTVPRLPRKSQAAPSVSSIDENFDDFAEVISAAKREKEVEPLVAEDHSPILHSRKASRKKIEFTPLKGDDDDYDEGDSFVDSSISDESVAEVDHMDGRDRGLNADRVKRKKLRKVGEYVPISEKKTKETADLGVEISFDDEPGIRRVDASNLESSESEVEIVSSRRSVARSVSGKDSGKDSGKVAASPSQNEEIAVGIGHAFSESPVKTLYFQPESPSDDERFDAVVPSSNKAVVDIAFDSSDFEEEEVARNEKNAAESEEIIDLEHVQMDPVAETRRAAVTTRKRKIGSVLEEAPESSKKPRTNTPRFFSGKQRESGKKKDVDTLLEKWSPKKKRERLPASSRSEPPLKKQRKAATDLTSNKTSRRGSNSAHYSKKIPSPMTSIGIEEDGEEYANDSSGEDDSFVLDDEENGSSDLDDEHFDGESSGEEDD